MSIGNDVDRVLGDATSTVIDRFSEVVPMVNIAYSTTLKALQTLASSLQGIHMGDVGVDFTPPSNGPTFTDLKGHIPDIASLLTKIELILQDLASIVPPTPPTYEPLTPPATITTPTFNGVKPIYIPPKPPQDLNAQPPDPFNESAPSEPTLTPPDPPDNFSGDPPSEFNKNEPDEPVLDFPPDPDEFNEDKPVLDEITPPEGIDPPAPFEVDAPEVKLPTDPEDVTINDILFTETLDFNTLPWNPPPPIQHNPEDAQEFLGQFTVKLTEKLIDMIIRQGYGMNLTVETAYMDRERERSLREHEDSINRAINEWAGRGFDLPSGDIQGKVLVLETTYRDKRLDISRDIIVENFKLEYHNLQFAVGELGKYEIASMDFAKAFYDRWLDVQKTNSQLLISILEAEIKRFNMRLDYFKTKMQEWETKVRVELSKVDLYKARVDIYLSKSEMEKTKVEIYKTQVQAYDTLVNAYKTNIQAYIAQFEIERMKIEKFKAEIESYNAQISLKKSEYDIYMAKTTLEGQKVNIYQSKIEAFKAQIDAWKALGEVYANKINLKIAEFKMFEAKVNGEDSKVKMYQGQVDAYKAKVDAYKELNETYLSQIQSKVAEYGMYRAQVEGAKAPIEVYGMESQIFKNKVDSYMGQVSAETAKVELPIKYNDALSKQFETLMKGYGLQIDQGLRKTESSFKGLDAQRDIFETLGKTYEVLGSLNVKSYDAEIQKAYFQSQLKLRAAEVELANYEKLTAVIVEGSKGAAQVAAQLCVGLASSVSAQAHISGSGQASESFNYSETHSWDETE